MKTSKEKLLNNFEFKIVEMEVFSDSNGNENNLANYYLLIADNLVIVDYKIIFKQIAIKDKTTLSHEKNKHKSNSLKFRKDILEILEVPHKFEDGNKEIHFFNSPKYSDVIKLVNEYIFSSEFSQKITFQNIEYILNGSNPSGQGQTGKGFLKIRYQNENVPFGIFLRSLNKVKVFHNYCRKNFNFNNFEELYNDNSIQKLSFEEWLSNSTLKKYFNDLKKYHWNWDVIVENIDKGIIGVVKKFNDINKKIINLRQKQKRNFESWFRKRFNTFNNQEIYKYYFGVNEVVENFDYAHIKPVYLIRQQYINKNKEDILQEISDINNFLPLPPSIHSCFDSKKIHWENNGKLITKSKNLPNDINYFSQISKIALNDIKKYLIEYNTKVFNKV